MLRKKFGIFCHGFQGEELLVIVFILPVMLWVLHFKTTLNSWLRRCRKARCRVVVGICYSWRCWLPNYLRVFIQVVTEAEVPTRCHSHPHWRASSWVRSLYLADQNVPTPKYTNKLLFVCLFIHFLPSLCCFPTGQNPLPGGSGDSSLGPPCQLPQEKGPLLWAVSSWALPHASLACITSWALSRFTFNHSWCGLFGFFHPSETLQLFLMPQTPSLS